MQILLPQNLCSCLVTLSVSIAGLASMYVRDSSIEKGVAKAAACRDSLLYKDGDKFFPKVCCVCNQFIKVGHEKCLN